LPFPYKYIALGFICMAITLSLFDGRSIDEAIQMGDVYYV